MVSINKQLEQSTFHPEFTEAERELHARSFEPECETLRILHFVVRLGVGGTEHGVAKIVSGLDSKRFKHRVCAVRGIDPAFPWMQAFDREVVEVGAQRGRQFPIRKLIGIIREFRPHIVHSRNWGSIEAVLAGKLARVPVLIHSEHGYEIEMLRGLPIRRRLIRRAMYSLCDSLFAVTRELRDYHCRQGWLNPDSMTVIYNGVDTERFSPRAEDRQRMRTLYQIPADAIVVGSVGRMVPIKDYPILLKAAERLIDKGQNLYILLVGNGPELERLQQLASNSPFLGERVIFTGAAINVCEIMNAMDVFVLPSITEGMSNTLLEAMATRLPVICTKVGGNVEVMGQELQDFTFRPGNIEQLAALLEMLCSGPVARKRVADIARDRVMKNFSLDKMFSEYTKLYLSAAERKGLIPEGNGEHHVRH
jgi:sugar transferase (PEP-CTERM/EpsH1 system associated)